MLAKECMELSETSFQVIIRGGFSPKCAKTLEPLSEDRKSLNLLVTLYHGLWLLQSQGTIFTQEGQSQKWLRGAASEYFMLMCQHDPVLHPI
jgi:hypothetical protein